MIDLAEIEIPSIACDGSISADWLAMTLADDARIENGRLANPEYLAVKIASVSDFILARAVKAEAELARLRAIPGLADVLDGKAVIVPAEPMAEMIKAVRDCNLLRGYESVGQMVLMWPLLLAASPYRKEPDHDRMA